MPKAITVVESQDTESSAKIQSKDFTWSAPLSSPVHGGISLREDGAMSWGGGEAREVIQNRLRYLERTGLDLKQAVFAEQVHGTEIRRVTSKEAGRGAFAADDRIPRTDGLITNEPGLILTTMHADCAPIFYVDSEHRAIGLAHAGWRGIYAGLPGKMLEAMEREFGSKRKDIEVAVGPMIGTDSYEVTQELAERFVKRFGRQVVKSTPLSPPVHGGKSKLDLFAALMSNLLENGLNPAKIPARPPCTACDPTYSSYRRDGAPPKSMVAWLTVR